MEVEYLNLIKFKYLINLNIFKGKYDNNGNKLINDCNIHIKWEELKDEIKESLNNGILKIIAKMMWQQKIIRKGGEYLKINYGRIGYN